MTSLFNKIRNRDYYDESSVPLLNSDLTDDNYITTSRAKKKWYLAYTLLHNPQLIELRRKDYRNETDSVDVVNTAI